MATVAVQTGLIALALWPVQFVLKHWSPRTKTGPGAAAASLKEASGFSVMYTLAMILLHWWSGKADPIWTWPLPSWSLTAVIALVGVGLSVGMLLTRYAYYRLGWKVLLPLSLVCVIAVAAFLQFGPAGWVR